MPLKVYLIRHGETDDNRNQIIQGQRNTSLNELGIRQAQVTGKFLKSQGIKFDRIWTSDLERAHNTANAIANEIDASLEVKTDKRLRERFLGDLEGKVRGSAANCSTAEATELVADRLLSFWNDELVGQLGKCERIMVVSHGAALRTLTEKGLIERLSYQDVEGGSKAPQSIKRFGNCSVTEVVIEDKNSGRILYVGWDGHLSGLEPGTVNNVDEVVSVSERS